MEMINQLGLNPTQFVSLVQNKVVLDRINDWAVSTGHGLFHFGGLSFNTEYRVTGWGWVFMFSPFPGVVQFWVEHVPSGKSKRFALHNSVTF